MQTKYKVILAIATLTTTFALGRYTVPTKTKIEKETSETSKNVENKQTETDRDKHKQTVVIERVLPDGSRIIETHTTEDTSTNRKTDSSSSTETAKTSKESKEVTREGSKVNISILAGTDLKFAFPPTTSTVIYGGHISKDFLGPISIGVWGLSNGTGGFSLGLSF